jgi:transglutaminase-like putative cysteine protease
MNIPARYVNGYLGHIGVPRNAAPMDFNTWFEAYLGVAWFTFDARHNTRRIGRIPIARERGACDVPKPSRVIASAAVRFSSVITQLEENDIRCKGTKTVPNTFVHCPGRSFHEYLP